MVGDCISLDFDGVETFVHHHHQTSHIGQVHPSSAVITRQVIVVFRLKLFDELTFTLWIVLLDAIIRFGDLNMPSK